MLDTSRLAAWLLSRLAQGPTLHRWGLEALAENRCAAAHLLLEAAGFRYRRDLAVEAIARVRIQQLMARVRAGRERGNDSGLRLEVERRLCQLERIESLAPPFELVETRTMLGGWQAAAGASRAVADAKAPELARAA